MFYILFFLFFIAISLRYNWWRLPISYEKPRVLMYHMVKEHLPNARNRNKLRVTSNDFEKQMAWFYKNGWHSYTISQMIEAENLPEKSFCITFDDGYEDNFTNAFPILKKYGFKATIYLVPHFKYNFWNSFDNNDYDKLLSDWQIEEMIKSGLIEFGSHTLNHKNLLTLSKENLEQEIVESKKEVENITKQKCNAFAYPFGKYNPDMTKIIKKAGYTSASTIKRGVYKKEENFEIKRLGILGTESFFDFYLKITRIRNKI